MSHTSSEDFTLLKKCRICHSNNIAIVLDLGSTPLANSFITKPDQVEKRFPLDLVFCNECGLVQLGHIVNPNLMFRWYLYQSSSSDTIPQHFRELAYYLCSTFITSSKQLVVEIGSNDGVLLRAFKSLGANVLGIEPAANLAKIANEQGLETIPEFFNSSMAHEVSKMGKAKLIVANNVFAHINDLHDFMTGVVTLLEDDGFVSVEFPYLGDLNQNVEYDTIYHEHLSYFTINPVNRLFLEYGMKIMSVKRLEVHGGSVQIIAKKTSKLGPEIPFLEFERRSGLGKLETYETLAYRVEYQKEYLKHALTDLKSKGNKIIGYGAPAKGNTMLNVCDIGCETLDYIIDSTPVKQGLFTPGTHIPIHPPEKFHKEQPPFALMLAWNYEKEILLKEQSYVGQFIIPLPYPHVLPKNKFG